MASAIRAEQFRARVDTAEIRKERSGRQSFDCCQSPPFLDIPFEARSRRQTCRPLEFRFLAQASLPLFVLGFPATLVSLIPYPRPAFRVGDVRRLFPNIELSEGEQEQPTLTIRPFGLLQQRNKLAPNLGAFSTPFKQMPYRALVASSPTSISLSALRSHSIAAPEAFANRSI
ncbi:hypothetical protein VTI74DRAFT_1526 [Chaetomium olivicolor]